MGRLDGVFGAELFRVARSAKIASRRRWLEAWKIGAWQSGGRRLAEWKGEAVKGFRGLWGLPRGLKIDLDGNRDMRIEGKFGGGGGGDTPFAKRY
jgi:hypothetical protein